MKRFLVFAGDDYYPLGGWWDFKGSYATFEEAKQKAQEFDQKFQWTQIVDLTIGDEITAEPKS